MNENLPQGAYFVAMVWTVHYVSLYICKFKRSMNINNY